MNDVQARIWFETKCKNCDYVIPRDRRHFKSMKCIIIDKHIEWDGIFLRLPLLKNISKCKFKLKEIL